MVLCITKLSLGPSTERDFESTCVYLYAYCIESVEGGYMHVPFSHSAYLSLGTVGVRQVTAHRTVPLGRFGWTAIVISAGCRASLPYASMLPGRKFIREVYRCPLSNPGIHIILHDNTHTSKYIGSCLVSISGPHNQGVSIGHNKVTRACGGN